MTNQEVLQKVIEKAGANGWNTEGNLVLNYTMYKILTEWDSLLETAYYQIIFREDFAKAFFGEEFNKTRNITYKYGSITEARVIKGWQYHLQQMVLAEDPIKYLEAYL